MDVDVALDVRRLNDSTLDNLLEMEIYWLEEVFTSPDFSFGVAFWNTMTLCAAEEIVISASKMIALYKNSCEYIDNASAKTILEWFESLPPDSKADCTWEDKLEVMHILEYADVKECRERAKELMKKYHTLGGQRKAALWSLQN